MQPVFKHGLKSRILNSVCKDLCRVILNPLDLNGLNFKKKISSHLSLTFFYHFFNFILKFKYDGKFSTLNNITLSF